MKLWYPLFDTLVMGVAVQTEQALFQVTQGADAVHTKSFTNMRGAGALSQGENFTIYKIGCFIDFVTLQETDAINAFVGNYLELRVSDESVLQAPLRLFAQNNAFGGHFTQAAAADNANIGVLGDGYELRNPVVIKGGTGFRVNIPQTVALSVAAVPFRVILHGELDRA